MVEINGELLLRSCSNGSKEYQQNCGCSHVEGFKLRYSLYLNGVGPVTGFKKITAFEGRLFLYQLPRHQSPILLHVYGIHTRWKPAERYSANICLCRND